MVLAHVLTPRSLGWNVKCAFHMPLYLLMSRCCFKENYFSDAKRFVVRIVVALIGTRSLSIMALHITAFKLVSYLLIMAHRMPIGRVEEFPVARLCKRGALIMYFFCRFFCPLYMGMGVAMGS